MHEALPIAIRYRSLSFCATKREQSTVCCSS